MPNYLLEIGTEELPAAHIPEAMERLEQLMSQSLKDANLEYETMRTFATPRRLAVLIKNVAAVQEKVTRKVKGPPVKSSFSSDGKPEKQAVGFAEKHKLTVEELQREEMGGVEYLIANVVEGGQPAENVLKDFAPKLITQISGERLMRWGSSDLKFSRPIRWLVSLLDDKVVPFKLDGLSAGSTTRGHRILAPGEHEVQSADSYVDVLRKAHVLVDPEERKKIIEDQVKAAARNVSGTPRQLTGPLLEEVVHITEWPSAVVGEYANEYLDLPDTLIETIMVHHQRYFPVQKPDAPAQTGDSSDRSDRSAQSVRANNLLPYFVTISNNDRSDAVASIKQGNERVIRARLADGRFFYFDDQKLKLDDRREALGQLTYQEGLGSYLDKVERLVKGARMLSERLKLDAKVGICLERTAELCKLDLVTNLVRELPELQGYVGAWYAEKEGAPPDVVHAITSHYSPRSTDDTIPLDTVGRLVSLIDKADNLVGLFGLGKRPSGSSDPFALRRQAQGLVDILMDGLPDTPVDLSDLLGFFASELEPKLSRTKKGFDRNAVLDELADFIEQRVRGKLLDKGIRREIVEAVMTCGNPLADLPDLCERAHLLAGLVGKEDDLEVIRIANRVGRIVQGDAPDTVDDKLLAVDAEVKLWSEFKKHMGDVYTSVCRHGAAGDKNWRQNPQRWQKGGLKARPPASLYHDVLESAKPLVPSIDSFFDNVLVNDQDEAKRRNRHALLRQIDQCFLTIANFTKLQPLLP